MTTVTNERPTGAEPLALYDAVGWTAFTRDPDTLAAAIAGSHLVLTARDTAGRLIGLARTVSDGATICYLQDILVDSGARRSGVGWALISAVLTSYADVRQFVLLTDADPTQRAFYRSVGLVRSYESGLHAYLRP
ncbi:MAG: GNAT family N-acetyltransferase [Actinomycetota bacterium]|nr:GNAT family N-acetyltransferase [Actinomycetota bacterium]